MSKTRNRLSVAGITLLLGACAGGGSFDTLEVNPEPPKLPESKQAEKVTEPRQNPEEQAALKQPAAGFAMKNVRRNQAKYGANGKPLTDAQGQPTQAETHLALTPDRLATFDSENAVTELVEKIQQDPNNRNQPSTPERRQADKYRYIRFGHVSVDFPQDTYETVSDADGQNRAVEHRSGANVYTFYHGTHTAPALPAANNVKYSGEWNFVTDAKLGRGNLNGNGFYAGNGFNKDKGDGDIASATDEFNSATDAKYTSEFNVDFDQKNLTGTLNYRSRTEAERKLYDIEAALNGNRFTGKAKSAVNEQSSASDKAFFYADSDLLEGGFYGNEGEELAGKFLANDNSLFAVFGAKREGKADKLNPLFDAVQISEAKRTMVEIEEEEEEFSEEETADSNPDETAEAGDNAENEDGGDLAEEENEDIEIAEPETQLREQLGEVSAKPLTNFGYAMKLRFGGKTFDLSQADWGADRTATLQLDGKQSLHFCCSNLSYLRFGVINSAGQDGNELIRSLFLQGERTPLAAMPQSGKLKYAGTWAGFIQTASPEKSAYTRQDFRQNPDMTNVDGKRLANRSEFDVDFDNKSLNGRLLSYDSRTVFNINAAINGSGFSGTAATPKGGFPFDPGNQLGSRTVEIENAAVQGGFYGPDAQELGGALHYNSEADGTDGLGVRAGAVFGATLQK
ncbi:MAG: transferrin-binding protein-like solute binding protein [Neisseria sp.]|nr:transferrin-binding protein-like solute binding protein [Neisseria sp.]